MITSDVISQLDLLNIDNKLERCLIGPEQRYISSLLNSGANNLEENLKIGQNEIITRWYGSDNNNEDCYRETIEFRNESISNKYYYIEYYEYDTQPVDTLDGKVSSTILSLDAHNEYNNYPMRERLIQKYELYFKDENNNSELISTKTIQVIYTHDPSIGPHGRWTETISHPNN